jgi:hypothetical protein
VAAVAKLHCGSLELGDNHPGLRATLILAPRRLEREKKSGSLIEMEVAEVGFVNSLRITK